MVYNNDGSIHLIVECKAPHIKITQNVFDQIAQYNMTLNAEYLMVTNGLSHYYCKMNYEAGEYEFLQEIPAYKSA